MVNISDRELWILLLNAAVAIDANKHSTARQHVDRRPFEQHVKTMCARYAVSPKKVFAIVRLLYKHNITPGELSAQGIQSIRTYLNTWPNLWPKPLLVWKHRR